MAQMNPSAGNLSRKAEKRSIFGVPKSEKARPRWEETEQMPFCVDLRARDFPGVTQRQNLCGKREPQGAHNKSVQMNKLKPLV